MKQKLNKAISATNGKKTYISAVLVLLMSLFGDKVPFLRDNQVLIEQLLEYLLEFGAIHKMWRHRKEVLIWIKNKFKKAKS